MKANATRPIRSAAAVSLMFGSLGCYQPQHDVEAPSREPALNVGIAWQTHQDAEAGLDQPAPGELALTFRVLTSPLGGQFAPSNVGAIWVETADGAFVKTLARWGRSRATYLRKFQAASKGNLVDAITSATLPHHEQHEVTWNLRALDQSIIPDGAYRLLVELTDKNSTGVLTEVPFRKGPEPTLVTPADTAQFHMMELAIDEL